MRLAWDPCHWKKGLFKRLFGAESLPYGLVYPKDLRGFESVDFLNEEHSEWRMPSGPRRNEGFRDLLNEAKTVYSSLHEALWKAKNGQDTKEEIAKIAAHLNHEGIVPGSPKTYWKLIWPSAFQQDVIEHPSAD